MPDERLPVVESFRTEHKDVSITEQQLRAQLDDVGRLGLRLEAERERDADLFERAPDAYIVTDRLGVIMDANTAAMRLFSIEARFLRGRSITAFAVEANVRAMNDALEMLDRDMTRAFDLLLRPRGGGEIPVVARVALSSAGQRLFWILREEQPPSTATTPDAGSSLDLARALREKDDLLKRERRARQELERSSRAKDRFIAVLSHDLRAPLNAILGWTQLLRCDALDAAERSRAFETIERNTRTQANLIEQLLDVSRMAADRIQLALAPVDASALAERAVLGALPKAREMGLEVSFRGEAGATVIADRQRLEQIVANLLSNAMKYTPPPGRIEVETCRDGGYVQLIVRDTGRGISPELLPVIFDMYMQEQNYSSSRDGLGLGLFIVKQLAELQDGTVRVETRGLGQGSTFTVSLPSHEEPVVQPSVQAMTVEASLRGLRVLVVEDEADSRELMATILRRAGAEVACASDIRGALEVHASWSPDIVVSDLAMPGGDGFELVSMLRSRDASMAAVAVSGFTSELDSARAIAAGFDLHIGKPVDGVELAMAVHDAARLRRP